MPDRIYAPLVRATAAYMASLYGPPVERYELPLDLGELFKFVVGSTLTADGVAVLGHSGGTAGRWVKVRRPDRGADLTELATGNATITVGGKRWRTIPAATLTTNRTITLATTNAAEGDEIEITRLDTTANTVTVNNGGLGGGTLVTLPVSARAWGRFYFNETSGNWLHRGSGLLL